MNDNLEKRELRLEWRKAEAELQFLKNMKKNRLKEIASRNGLTYKSVKKMDQKMRRDYKREYFNE